MISRSCVSVSVYDGSEELRLGYAGGLGVFRLMFVSLFSSERDPTTRLSMLDSLGAKPLAAISMILS